MTRQQTRPDVAEQRTLTESINDSDAADSVPQTQATLIDRARTHAADVAVEHFPGSLSKRLTGRCPSGPSDRPA